MDDFPTAPCSGPAGLGQKHSSNHTHRPGDYRITSHQGIPNFVCAVTLMTLPGSRQGGIGQDKGPDSNTATKQFVLEASRTSEIHIPRILLYFALGRVDQGCWWWAKFCWGAINKAQTSLGNVLHTSFNMTGKP